MHAVPQASVGHHPQEGRAARVASLGIAPEPRAIATGVPVADRPIFRVELLPGRSLTPAEVEALQKSRTQVKRAWITATIVGFSTIVLSIVFHFAGHAMRPTTGLASQVDIYGVGDGLLVIALAFGAFRHSRTCLAFLVVIRLITMCHRIAAPGVPHVGIDVVFLFLYGSGLLGAVKYHQIAHDHFPLLPTGTRLVIISVSAILVLAAFFTALLLDSESL